MKKKNGEGAKEKYVTSTKGGTRIQIKENSVTH